MNQAPPRALIVGAGAVGQVYGHPLARAGHQVEFFVKPHHLDHLTPDLTLYRLRQRTRRTPHTLRVAAYRTDWDDVATHTYDQLWLCISTTALRRLDLPALARARGDATVINMTPGLEDRALLREHLPDAHLVQGSIPFVSYQAPLGPERVPHPGIAYWTPPRSTIPLTGERAPEIARALTRGNLPARAHPHTPWLTAQGGSLLMPQIAALERAGWSFREFRRRDHLALGARASRQTLAVVARYHQRTPPPWTPLVRAWPLRTLFGLAPPFLPYDLETFFAYHFTKVGDQTRYNLSRYIQLGAEHDLPTDALQHLLDDLRALNPPPPTT